MLDDNHSFYRGTNVTLSAGSGCDTPSPNFQFEQLPETIAYVQVNSASSGDRDFAEAVHRTIAEQNTREVQGWVVDLSRNLGGSMYPMLAGVSPLLDEGVLGYFIDPDDERTPWSQRDGTVFLDGSPVMRMEGDFELLNPEAKIAVVIGGTTASSGEATLISFLGNERVKTFGQPTCGLSTANRGYNLSDGGQLLLTVAVMADRDQNPFGGVIPPDVEADNTAELYQGIRNWLVHQL